MVSSIKSVGMDYDSEDRPVHASGFKTDNEATSVYINIIFNCSPKLCSLDDDRKRVKTLAKKQKLNFISLLTKEKKYESKARPAINSHN